MQNGQLKKKKKEMGKIIAFGIHLFSIFASIIAPIEIYLYVTAFNILIDFVVGSYRAVVFEDKPLSRTKMMKTVESLVWFFIAMFSAHIFQIFLTPTMPLLLTVAISINTFYFFRSLKNISAITKVDIWNDVIQLFQKNKKNSSFSKGFSKDFDNKEKEEKSKD